MRAPSTRVVLTALTSSLTLGSIAHAAPAKKQKLAAEEVAVMLASSREEEVRSALEQAPLLATNVALPMVEDRLRAGLPRGLLDVAIDSLLLMDDRSAGGLLAELARHRRPEIRIRALESLVQLKAPEAKAALTQALGDQTPEVRSAAAAGLGALGDHGNFALVMRAFERDIDGAARALGQLATAQDLGTIYDAALDRYGLERWQPMFEVLLARKDLPDAEKLRAIDKVVARGGEDSELSLAALQQNLPENASPRVEAALAEAIKKSENQ